MPPTPTICAVCGKPYTPRTNARYCSQACAKVRQAQQLAAHAERRRLARQPLPPRPCAVCGLPLTPKHARHIYCGLVCQEVGLQRAVDRQKERRAKAKEGWREHTIGK